MTNLAQKSVPFPTHRPLAGKTILVTRARDQAVEFVRLLEQLGAKVIGFPTIQIVPTRSWDDCDRAINNLDQYHSILFTSANAVEKFVDRLNHVRGHAAALLNRKTVYAVGTKTRLAAERHGIRGSVLSDVYDAKHFAIVLSRLDVSGKRFLFPKGGLSGDTVATALRDLQARVDEVVVYETVRPPSGDTEMIRQKFDAHEIDVITFFSPSSVSNFLTMIPPQFVHDVVIAVIGATTAAAAKTHALPVHIVADQATPANLAVSIVRYYE